MMPMIHVTDVTLHVDETLAKEALTQLEHDLRAMDGVTDVRVSKKTPHLITVSYDLRHVRSENILKVVLGEHLHAELIG